jgi:hypothetical protein
MDNFSKNREDIRLRKSREKLFSLCSTKIRTTMIGAISDIESLFPDAVKDNPELFQELRSSILDRGNNQIRNLENDLYDYDINQKNSNLNTIYLPVKRKGQ